MLKVPKNFIDDITDKPDVAALTEGIIQLARALNLAVVAEGIETLEQADQLRRMRCDLGQGYSFGKPLDAQAVAPLLARQRSDEPMQPAHPQPAANSQLSGR
jgi:EAL domain-containing protein (putative c-di-GMP-specific phosphodiesterase class I)